MLEQSRLAIQGRQSRFAEDMKTFGASLEETLSLLKNFELLTGDLYRLRAQCPKTDPLRMRMEDYLAGVSQEILAFQKIEEKKNKTSLWVLRYRKVWRDNLSLFLFTLFLFLAGALLGWHSAMRDPNNALAFVSEGLLEDVLDKRKWFEAIQSSPWTEGFLIAKNNITVALHCFLLGTLLGLGGLFILSYNALMLGAVLSFCYQNDFHDALIHFVVGHGTLEMTIIIAAAFSGFLVGRVFYMRPYRLFKVRFQRAAGDAKDVMLGLLPWLVVAAAVEVFVSPWPQFPFPLKLSLSLLLTAAFWVWTLWPVSLESQGHSK